MKEENYKEEETEESVVYRIELLRTCEPRILGIVPGGQGEKG